MSGKKLGSGSFCRVIGITGNKMRELEAAGIVTPTKTESGWRQFGQDDVDAAKAWKSEHLAAKKARRA